MRQWDKLGVNYFGARRDLGSQHFRKCFEVIHMAQQGAVDQNGIKL